MWKRRTPKESMSRRRRRKTQATGVPSKVPRTGPRKRRCPTRTTKRRSTTTTISRKRCTKVPRFHGQKNYG